MQAFQTTTGPAPGPRNYVFVDEHNRHKRLKVMRACEGCRRRKIKCDAATTNTWPCGACRRLKLPCVPPAGGLDGDQTNDSIDLSSSQELQKDAAQQFTSSYDTYVSHYPTATTHDLNSTSTTAQYNATAPQQLYSPSDYGYVQHNHIQIPPSVHDYQYQPIDNAPSQHSASSPRSPDRHTAEILTEQLGELQISETGVAPYIRQQKSSAKEPAGPIQEREPDPFPLSTAAGSQIRIPPALMPSEDDAAEYFEIFFEHVHPYAPVVCRNHFYHQWNNDRDSISPLLLEAIFACARRMSGEPVGDSAWLALANKHEASFLDTPRLSTIQALILILKAREGSPKRGYFYKSWMTCKTIVSMAKDLDLNEHLSTHQAGEHCGSSPTDCLVKTRIWQTLLVCETMIGGPQGRSDFGVDPDTIELSTNPPNADIDEFEALTSRRYAFFIRNARNIRLCLGAYMRLRKKKDWALDPAFVSHNEDFRNWPSDLPEDLQVVLPEDSNSPPHITSHFIGNLHSHHQLGIIMMHRPQLVAQKTADEGQWRYHLLICYNAAKRLCRLQEGVVAQHDVMGLLCMQRGMSFTVYAILTCIMLHLIAITSPDPEFNQDAREYFIRHMRLLEKCIPEWPMAETEQQINNLRAAFSADLDKPFDLKPSFPYGSPSDYSPGTRRPSEQHSMYGGSQDQAGYVQQHWQQQDGSHFPTPPMSISADASHPQTPSIYQDYNTPQAQPQYRQVGPTSYPSDMTQNQQWNPTPIIDQFSTAFAIPPSALAPPQTSGYGSSPPIVVPPSMSHQQFTPSPQTPTYDHNVYNQHHNHTMQSQSTSQMTPQHQRQPQSQTTPTPQQYLDTHLHSGQQMQHNITQSAYLSENSASMSAQSQQTHLQQHNSSPSSSQAHQPGMVYVTPRQWQQSVASVYDPSGLKRKWHFDMQNGMPPH